MALTICNRTMPKNDGRIKYLTPGAYPYFILALMMAAYAVFFSAQLLLHHYSFGTRAMDVASMDQATWNTLHGRFFQQTNHPFVTSRLGLHVEPIFLPLSLLYLIYSGPETLFVFESIVVALGAIPVFALARHKLHNHHLALLFAFIYLMFPAIQGANMVEFHPITLTPTFLLAAFYFLETERPKLFALFAVLAVSCKEDVSLLILMMGLYALVIKRRYLWGGLTIGLALAWALLAVFVIPPLFADTRNIHWDRYDHLGASAPDILLNLFRQPRLFLAQLQAANALTYLRLLLTPTAFTALFNPVTLLLALPSLGINLLSNFTPMQEANRLIYAAPLVPAILISSIYGVANLKSWLADKYRLLSPAVVYTLLGLALLLATLIYHAQYGFFSGGGQFRGWEAITPHHRAAAQIFAQIPPDAAVSAQDSLVPHLSQRQKIYIFDRVNDAEYLVFDVSEDAWPLHPLDLRHRIEQFLAKDFGVVDAYDGYLLLAKNRPNLPKTMPDPFFDFARVDDPASFRPAHPTDIVFADKLRLLGYQIEPDPHRRGMVVITLYWQALEPLAQDYVLWPFFIDRQGNLVDDPSAKPLVAPIWYPTSQWSPDEVIITRTLPQTFTGQVTLAVGVAQEDWTDETQRLPVTQADDDLYLFEQNTWVRLATFYQSGRYAVHIFAPLASSSRPQHPRQVTFGGHIRLLGVDLPNQTFQPGQAIPFSLYWQSDTSISFSLTNFAHLLDNEDNLVAQLDWIPQDSLGFLPTTAWKPQRPVVDAQTLDLPPDLLAGQYRLIMGWYYPPTGERVPVTTADELPGAGEDFIEVGIITVK
ncbi:MAG: DUF2079 domain-containing protein [Anaerolineae bacterium]|nr:DUF2079 domain-containing protein [Anaerolineae bacterium]